MVSDASDELDTIMVSDASEEFEAPQEPGTPALRRSSRRIRLWAGSSKKRGHSKKRMCPLCESSPSPKKSTRSATGRWANGLCWRHAVESGFRPPMCRMCESSPSPKKKNRITAKWANGLCWRHAKESGCRPPKTYQQVRWMCKKCVEIGRKEDEATDKGMPPLARTELKLAHLGSWANGMCARHARLAGLSKKKKLFDNAGEKQHIQMKLPFLWSRRSLVSVSESQMAVDGSIEE